MVESFWGRMQTELVNTRKWRTRVELSTEMFGWIELFYNRTSATQPGHEVPGRLRKLDANDTSAA